MRANSAAASARAADLLGRVGFLVGEELERFQVGHLRLQRDERADLGAQRGDFLDLPLSLFLAVPETRLAHERFQFAQARLFAGQVKDTSADCRRGL